MCSIIEKLVLNCGPTPTLEYAVIAAGVVAVIVFLLRP